MNENEEIIIVDEKGIYIVLIVSMFAAILALVSMDAFPSLSISIIVITLLYLGFSSYREIYKSKNKIQISALGCKYNEEFFPWENIYYVSKNLISGFEFRAYLDGKIYYRSVFTARTPENKIINLDLYPLIKSRVDAVENITDDKIVNFSRSTNEYMELSLYSSIIMLVWFIGLICSLKYKDYFVVRSTLQVTCVFYIVLFVLLNHRVHRWLLKLDHYEFKTKIKHILHRVIGVMLIALITTLFFKEIVLAYNYSEILSTRVNTFLISDINYVSRSSKTRSWFVFETKFINQANINEKYTFDLNLKCEEYLKLRKKVDFTFYKGRLGLEFINSSLVKKLDECGLY